MTGFKAYDPAEIESIRQMLVAEAAEGKALYFEVKVNGFTRIHKTNKVERFEELYNFINENSKELVISVFPEISSSRKEWYKYKLNASNESLNGVDIESKVKEQMQLHEERSAAERVKEKLAEALKKLEDAEEYIELLQTQLEESKAKPNHLGSIDLGKLAGTTIESLAVHYPKLLDKVPVLNGIAKVIQEDSKSKPKTQHSSFEGEVSFKPKRTVETEEPNEHEEAVKRLSDFIADHFDDNQKLILGWVIEALGEKPEQLSTVAELLNINLETKMQE